MDLRDLILASVLFGDTDGNAGGNTGENTGGNTGGSTANNFTFAIDANGKIYINNAKNGVDIGELEKRIEVLESKISAMENAQKC